MPNPTYQNDVQINRIHSVAICNAVGETLSVTLGPQSNELSPRLVGLMKQLAMDEADGIERMKDFSNASFAPDIIKVMTQALNGALSTLPHPVSSTNLQSVAETILRTAKDGERDPAVLTRMALLELQISPRL
jgi:hypothetical protein